MAILLAALFTSHVAADDSPLAQVEAGMHDLIYRLSRSIVSVEATRAVSGVLPGFPGQVIQSSSSTGLVCDADGHILANASAVAGYDQIQVTGEDRSLPARIVAIDYQNDFAILSTSMPVGQPVQEYTSRAGCIGQMVLSLSNSGGLRASPSIGFCAGCRTDGFLQFSLPVPESSVGGGVFDLSGRLIGVIVGQSENSGLQASALPAYKLPEIIDYLLTRGTRWAGFAGVATRFTQIIPPIEIASSDQHLASFGGITQIDHGAVVTAVLPGSPAAKAGVLAGDLILSLDNSRVDSPDDIARIIMAAQPTSVVVFRLFRNGHQISTRVQIEARPSELLKATSGSGGSSARSAGSRIADSLMEVLSRLRDEVSRVERRLQSID